MNIRELIKEMPNCMIDIQRFGDKLNKALTLHSCGSMVYVLWGTVSHPNSMIVHCDKCGFFIGIDAPAKDESLADRICRVVELYEKIVVV